MLTTYKTRWRGHRIKIALQNRSYIRGGQQATLIVRTSQAIAEKLGVSKVSKYNVNPDIIETIGGETAYAKKLLCNIAQEVQHRRQHQITSQIPLFGSR